LQPQAPVSERFTVPSLQPTNQPDIFVDILASRYAWSTHYLISCHVGHQSSQGDGSSAMLVRGGGYCHLCSGRRYVKSLWGLHCHSLASLPNTNSVLRTYNTNQYLSRCCFLHSPLHADYKFLASLCVVIPVSGVSLGLCTLESRWGHLLGCTRCTRGCLWLL
jgi:hypothetical protein